MAVDQTLENYDTNPANNHPKSADDGSNTGPYPFWQAVSDVEANLKLAITQAEWVSFKGVANFAVAFVNGTTATIGTIDFTGAFRVGRRVKAFVTAGTIYGNIATSVFAAGTTTITVNWDSGALDAGLTNILLSLIGTDSTSPLGPQIAIGTSAGTDTYTTVLNPTPTSLAALQDKPIFVEFLNANTGAAATLAPNGLAATPIKKWSSGVLVALANGDIPADYAGILWYDGAQFQLLNPAPGGPIGAVLILNRQSGNPLVDVVNSAAETSLYSFSIPGNTIGINQRVRLTLLGDFFNNTGGNQTVELKVKFGGTTVLDTTAITVPTFNLRGGMKFDAEIHNLGATNAQVVYGTVDLTGSVANGSMVAPAASPLKGQFAGLAIDTTIAQTLQVTVTLGAANAALEFRCWGAILELL